MKDNRDERRMHVFVWVAIMAVVWLLVAGLWVVAHAAEMIDWQPQASGMMALYWDRNQDGRVDRETWHVIRWHGPTGLSVEALTAQAAQDRVWMFWIETDEGRYVYAVEREPRDPM